MTGSIRDMKIKLRRRMDAGDEPAGVLLHDIIVEETGLQHQNSFKSEREWHHIKSMEGLVGPWLTEGDWDWITSGRAEPHLTLPEVLEAKVAELGEVAPDQTAPLPPRLPPVDRPAWEAKRKPETTSLEPTSPDLTGAPPGPEPPPVEADFADEVGAVG